MSIPEPPREDGWYRVMAHTWIRVTDEAAQAEIEQGGGWDLVHVQSADMTTEPLF